MAAPTGTVPASTLAGLFGIDERTIRKLAADGIVVKGGARGQYQLGASIKAYCAHLREQAAGRLGRDDTIDPATEKALLSREQRRNYQLKNALLAGTAISLDMLEPAWAIVLRAVRSGMMAIPAQLGLKLPHLTAFDRQLIDDVIRQQLADAAFVDMPPQPRE